MKNNNDVKNTFVPPLRFPEFWDTEGWEKMQLGDVTYSVSKKNRDGIKLPIYSINNKEGFLPQSDQFVGMDSNERGYDITLYKIIQRNTFAYNPARIDVGSLGYSGDLDNIIISSLYVCFKTNELVDDIFFLHFLKTNYFIQAVKNATEGGIRSYLFYENFSTIKFYLPPSVSEQQKIAACLTSLDDLITAESAKLDALKVHKKGLMQQLFPAEGETVPVLRFKEFVDTEGWVEKSLGEVAVFSSGGTPSKDVSEYWGGEIPWISAASMHNTVIDKSDSNITQKAVKDGAQLAQKGVLLILVRGSMLHKRIPIGITTREVAFNQDVKALKLDKEITTDFLLYLLVAAESRLLNAVTTTGIGAGKLDTNELKQFIIMIPPSVSEQERIATCLSTLDGLIQAQSEKVMGLKGHKKGLMQHLFPSAAEAELPTE